MPADIHDTNHGAAKQAGAVHGLHERLEESFNGLEQICRRLEVVADGLPDSVDIGDCNEMASTLYSKLKSAHEFEEAELFPLIAQQLTAIANISGVIERLRFEHWEDEAYATEVQDALGKFVKSPRSANIEGLSWMLRGFFETVRRHVAFERDFVLPLLAA